MRLKHLILGLCLSGCSPKITSHTQTIIKDSTVYRVNYKDTTIVVPAYKAELDGLLLTIDTLGRAQLPEVTSRSGRASIKVSVKDNKLKAEANCDSLELVVQLKQEEIDHLRSENRETTIVKEVKYIPDWVKYLAIFGGLMIIYWGWRLFILIMRIIN